MKEEEVEVSQYDGLPAPFINFATLNENFFVVG
jgi:hypothetical protein